MNKFEDIEKAPMLAHPDQSSLEEEDEELHTSKASFQKHSNRSNPFFSKPFLTAYAILGILILLALILWATDRARPWRRTSVYWNVDEEAVKAQTPSKILKPEAYLTGNRTRSFRGTHFSIIQDFSNSNNRFITSRSEVHYRIRICRLE